MKRQRIQTCSNITHVAYTKKAARLRSPSLLYNVSNMCRIGNAPATLRPISTYSLIGSQVNTTPRRLNTLLSTSESITVECT